MFSALGTGSITTWTPVGGTPITPAAFSDSVLRSFMQLYQKFKVRALVVHYITSSSTASTGDVMFYYGKNRDSVFLNVSSTQLLPLVMSDSNTKLGPQWNNLSARIKVSSGWKSTDYGMDSAQNQYCDGELFLLSKTATTDSPGYVIFDYDIEFAELQVTPRLLSLPLTRIQWTQLNLQKASGAITAGDQIVLTTGGNSLGPATSTNPTGATSGDIYKVILDITNSGSASWVNITTAQFATGINASGQNYTFTVADGTTLYARLDANSKWAFYNSLTAAVTGGTEIIMYSNSATNTFNWQVWVSYCQSINVLNLQPNF
jgi:hypothetical protein